MVDESPLVTVTFERVGARTELTLRMDLPPHISDDGVREWLALGVREGWRDTVDRLAALFERTATNV